MVHGDCVVLLFGKPEDIPLHYLVGDYRVDYSGERELRVGGEDITGGKP